MPPAQGRDWSTLPAAAKKEHVVARAHLTMPQGTSPTYRRSFLAGPAPPYLPSPQHPRVLQAQHPMATRSEPQWHEDMSRSPGRA